MTLFSHLKMTRPDLIGGVRAEFCRGKLCIAEVQRKALQAHLFYTEKLCKKTELRVSKPTKFAEITGANDLYNELRISKF